MDYNTNSYRFPLTFNGTNATQHTGQTEYLLYALTECIGGCNNDPKIQRLSLTKKSELEGIIFSHLLEGGVQFQQLVSEVHNIYLESDKLLSEVNIKYLKPGYQSWIPTIETISDYVSKLIESGESLKRVHGVVFLREKVKLNFTKLGLTI